jgi:hypothetical protein
LRYVSGRRDAEIECRTPGPELVTENQMDIRSRVSNQMDVRSRVSNQMDVKRVSNQMDIRINLSNQMRHKKQN